MVTVKVVGNGWDVIVQQREELKTDCKRCYVNNQAFDTWLHAIVP